MAATANAWRDARAARARRCGLPLTAAGDVHMHVRERRALQDALTAVRHGVTVAEAGERLYPNGERHLRERERLARLYPPELLAETVKIAALANFSLDELRYEYPRELVPAGETPASHLRKLTEAGARKRWPAGIPDEHAARKIDYELALIADLQYESYFLTVHDIVSEARRLNILCQGRGSAANSVVCYCLGVTEVDPSRGELLMERFISRERNEPPDIDIDFEHERREEVIQYIYRKYGRDRTALTATVISYRPRSALRDMAKVHRARRGAGRAALGRHAMVGHRGRRGAHARGGLRARQSAAQATARPGRPVAGLPATPVAARRRLRDLAGPARGTGAHRERGHGGSHRHRVGQGRSRRSGPAQGGRARASACCRRCAAVSSWSATSAASRSRSPTSRKEDARVYEMISRADTIGVFQVESRAQMSMLPRLQPREFYDLVIEVAIVRPGPIQGGMVHPYLRRRQGLEPVTYPSEAVKGVLSRTLGVPIFQEQVMQLAIVAAGFTPGEADQLRRSMAAWKRRGGLGHFEQRLIDGMRARGYDESFARQIFSQIQGFGEYGFPESHAASFALLVYSSAWLKCYEPAAFTCALLNSQPMGFYAPAQLVRDARDHGVEVRPISVCHSDWDCTLERRADDEPALRLGLRMVKGSERGSRASASSPRAPRRRSPACRI